MQANAYSFMISFSLAEARVLTLVSNFLVNSWVLSLQVSQSSSLRILSFWDWSACLLASRRILRIEIRDSSANSLTRETSCLRRSVERGGDVESDESSVGIRGQTHVASLDGLGDRAQGRGVEGTDNDLLGFGTTDAGDLLERSWGAVVIDPDRIDQSRSSASGADPLQLFLEDFNGLFHAVFRIQ